VTRAGLVGTGLLGGSVGLALRRAGIDVRGYDRDPVSAARAVELGVLDEAVPTLADAAAGADVVFVAVPVGAIAGAVVEALDAGANVVTDVGSVTLPAVATAQAERPDRAARYVGGHPMAGT
jgi:prephenate dehydrogenase